MMEFRYSPGCSSDAREEWGTGDVFKGTCSGWVAASLETLLTISGRSVPPAASVRAPSILVFFFIQNVDSEEAGHGFQ